MDYTGPMDHPDHSQQGRSQGGPFSMVKDTNGLTVCSDGPLNKYDPEVILLTFRIAIQFILEPGRFGWRSKCPDVWWTTAAVVSLKAQRGLYTVHQQYGYW